MKRSLAVPDLARGVAEGTNESASLECRGRLQVGRTGEPVSFAWHRFWDCFCFSKLGTLTMACLHRDMVVFASNDVCWLKMGDGGVQNTLNFSAGVHLTG